MTAPLPDSVRIFGIEAHGERGMYQAADPEKGFDVDVTPNTIRTGFWAGACCHGGAGWMLEGPVRPTPELAVAALHDLVRKLAGEIR